MTVKYGVYLTDNDGWFGSGTPKICQDFNNVFHMVYMGDHYTNSHPSYGKKYHAYSTDKENWTINVFDQQYEDRDYSYSDPAVVSDSDGNVFIIYEIQLSGIRYLKCAKWNGGDSYTITTIYTASDLDESIEAITATVDINKNIHVVCNIYDWDGYGNWTFFHFTRSNETGLWSQVATFTYGKSLWYINAFLQATPNGKLYHCVEKDRWGIAIKEYSEGTWGSHIMIFDASPDKYVYDLAFVVDTNSDYYVCWVCWATASSGVVIRRTINGILQDIEYITEDYYESTSVMTSGGVQVLVVDPSTMTTVKVYYLSEGNWVSLDWEEAPLNSGDILYWIFASNGLYSGKLPNLGEFWAWLIIRSEVGDEVYKYTYFLYMSLIPTITTIDASSITYDSAQLNGKTDDTFDELRFYWGVESMNLIYTEIASGTTGEFNKSIAQLEAAKTYYFKAGGIKDGTDYHGEELSFTTLNPADYNRTSKLTVIVQDKRSRPIFLAECIAWTYGGGLIERQWSDNGYATFNCIPNNIPVYVTAQWGSNYIRWDNVYCSGGDSILQMVNQSHTRNTDSTVKGVPTSQPSSPATGMVYIG